MTAFNRAWSMLKKQYVPLAHNVHSSGPSLEAKEKALESMRMPRPHPYDGDMPVGPDPLLRDPEQSTREGAMRNLLHRLLNEPPTQTHGPLPPSGQFIPYLVPDAEGRDMRPKHAGSFMSEVHQPPIYRPPVSAPYHTAEHAPDYPRSPDYPRLPNEVIHINRDEYDPKNF